MLVCPLYKTEGRQDAFDDKKNKGLFPKLNDRSLNQEFSLLLTQEDNKCTKELSKFITQCMNRSKELEKHIIGDNKASHTK